MVIIDIVPAQQWMEDETWFLGTADAVYQSRCIQVMGRNTYYLPGPCLPHGLWRDACQHVNSKADFTVMFSRPSC